MRIVAGLLSLALVSACGQADPGAGVAEDVVAEKAQAGPAALSVSMPRVAYTYRLGFLVPRPDMAAVQNRHLALCDRLGAARCQMTEMARGGDGSGDAAATMTLRVDARLARTFTRALEEAVGGAGGRVVDTAVTGEGVSKDMTDTEARIRQRELLVGRLTEILRTRQGQVSDLVEAERRVAEAQEELDQARSRLADLRGRVAMSTFLLRYDALGGAAGRPGPLGEAVTGSAALFSSGLAGILRLLIYLAPWAVLGGLGWFAWRRLRPTRMGDID